MKTFSLVALWLLALAGPPAAALPTDLGRAVVSTASGFSVTAWVKLDRLDGAQTFVSQDGKSVSGFALEKRGDGRFAFTRPAADDTAAVRASAASDFAPTAGLWYQLVGVSDAAGRRLRLYANGLLLASAPFTAPWRAAGHTVIGRGLQNGRAAAPALGVVDRVVFDARALSDAQVAARYRADRVHARAKTFTWANPVYFQGSGPGDDIHDPDILNDGGVYYAVATLAPFRNYTDRDSKLPDLGSAPGIKLYASRDLKVWKFKSWILKSSSLPDDRPYKHQFWAPEIHKLGRRYFVIFGGSNWIADRYNVGGHMGYYQFVGVADRVTGPYSHFTALQGPGVDTSLFEDDDGKTYAVWPSTEIHPIDLSRIDQGRITVGPKLSQATVPNDFKALGHPAPNTVEGPYLIKRRGVYYCFFAETYPDLYATGVATATSLSGPWHLDPRWRVFPGGHQAEFVGPDGRFWTAYKHEKSGTTPWLSLDPLDFDAQGRVQVTPTEGPQSVPLHP